MSRLLVAAPMRIEAALISSASRRAVVRKTGMGPRRSKAAAGELASASTDASSRESRRSALILGAPAAAPRACSRSASS